MDDRILYSCIAASVLVHMATIPAASLMIRAMPSTPVHVPVELVNVPQSRGSQITGGFTTSTDT